MDYILFMILLITLLLLALGVEILVVLGLATVMLTIFTGVFSMENFGLTLFDSINTFSLLAMPLFILTGDLLAASGIAQKLIQFARSLIGWIRGGLALTNIVAAAFFAAISGSNAATTATVGRIMIPEMDKDKYPRSFSAATSASGGVVGVIIPPSVIFIIYGVTSGVPVGDLFIAGILPGLLLVILMIMIAYFWSRKNEWGTKQVFNWKNLLKDFWGAKLAFLAMIIILGGIYTGVFTPTESGAVAAVYVLFMGLFVTRKIKFKELPKVLEVSGKVNGSLAPIIAVAIGLSQILAYLKLPQYAVDILLGISENPFIIMLIILAVLLIAGAVMETSPNVVILAPLLAPVALSIGYDPIHFGVIMVVALAIGFITPPIGLNLFVASSISGVPVMLIALKAIPYLIFLLGGLLIITFVPWLSLGLLGG